MFEGEELDGGGLEELGGLEEDDGGEEEGEDEDDVSGGGLVVDVEEEGGGVELEEVGSELELSSDVSSDRENQVYA